MLQITYIAEFRRLYTWHGDKLIGILTIALTQNLPPNRADIVGLRFIFGGGSQLLGAGYGNFQYDGSGLPADVKNRFRRAVSGASVEDDRHLFGGIFSSMWQHRSGVGQLASVSRGMLNRQLGARFAGQGFSASIEKMEWSLPWE